MNVSWLGLLMLVGWGITLIGGLGIHILENFNGRRLEAYCRLRRKPQRFGEILDQQEEAASSAQYLLLFGLVVGSLAAGAWLATSVNVDVVAGRLTADVSLGRLSMWVSGWLLLLTLAGLWLPRVVVHYRSSLLLFHAWPMWQFVATLTRPISGLGDAFSWLGHRLSDEPDGEEMEEEILEDEIRTKVTAGQRDGVFSDGVTEMIQGIMDLDENDVEGIMTPRSLVDAVNVELAWNEVVKMVANCGRTRIPVFRGTMDNVIGILFVKDLLSALADESFRPGPNTLETILRKPWFIPASKSVDDLLRVFLHNRNHMAIVVDDYQQFVGVVTIEDALEEIVGEISDELDTDEASAIVYDEENHQIEAEGKVPIESLSKLLGVQLPESDDYGTVGGLVIHRLSAIPKVGTQVDLDGVRITILQATRRAIQRVRLELTSDRAAS